MPGGPTDRSGWRGPIAGLRDVADFLANEERASSFLRGLTVGALVGAAIAGSRIWQRRRRRGADNVSPDSSGVPTDAADADRG